MLREPFTGWFDDAVHALHGMGRHTFSGYQAANLIVFCVLYPAMMLGLWIIALKQRRVLKELTRE